MGQQTQNLNMDAESFKSIAHLAYRESGLQLVEEKTSMIQSRLRNRLKSVGLETFAQYAEYVCSEAGSDERRQMISALTTNVSHFFREEHHFDILLDRVVAKKMETLKNGGSLRIWSAGCSNGQEAYSILMRILNVFPEALHYDVKILATDIDPKVVEFGARAEYPERFISSVPSELLKKNFSKKSINGETLYQAQPILTDRAFFKELNLLSFWPMKQKMDAIFCRNVLIYFDNSTQKSLWPRFHEQLTTEGMLFLGHSERISDPESNGFVNDGPTTYRRINR